MKRTVSSLVLNRDIVVETLRAVEGLLQNGGGSGWVSAEAVQRHLSEYDSVEIVGALNKLASGPSRKLVLTQDEEREVLVSLIPANVQDGCKTLLGDDTASGSTTIGELRSLVFDEIAKCGAKGTTVKVLKRTGIKSKLFNEIVDDLMRGQLIRLISRPQAVAKKIYLCSWMKEHSSLTVPVWYDGKGFYDLEFRNQLEKIITDYVFANVKPLDGKTAQEVLKHVTDTKALLKADEMTVQNLRDLLQLMVYEKKLDRQGDLFYAVGPPKRAKLKAEASVESAHNALSYVMACPICPYFDVCAPGGRISPDACIYLHQKVQYSYEDLF